MIARCLWVLLAVVVSPVRAEEKSAIEELSGRYQRLAIRNYSDDDVILHELQSNPADVEVVREAFQSKDTSERVLGACFLALLDDDEAIQCLADGLGKIVRGQTHFNAYRVLTSVSIPKLASDSRFGDSAIQELDPTSEGWQRTLQVAGKQRIAAIQPVLRRLLLGEDVLPDVERVVYWLDPKLKDFEAYQATRKYLQPEVKIPEYQRPWGAMNYFLSRGDPQIREHYFRFLKAHGGPKGHAGFNYNYPTVLCRYGTQQHLDEIRALLVGRPMRMNGSPVDALARILKREAKAELLALCSDQWHSDRARHALVKLFAGTGDVEVVGMIANHLNEARDRPAQVESLLRSALEMGGTESMALARRYQSLVPEERRQFVHWAVQGLKLEDLIKAMKASGIPVQKSADAYRVQDEKSYGRKRVDGEISRVVLAGMAGVFDSEADELPRHQVVLERLAEHPFQGLGIKVVDWWQRGSVLDEDKLIQLFKAGCTMNGVKLSFTGESRGDWYDVNGVLKMLRKGVRETKEEWDLWVLKEQDQAVTFHVGPVALLENLEKRFLFQYDDDLGNR